MIHNLELLQYSVELTRMAVAREALQRKLIIQTADLQDFESNLFRLCVLDFAEEVDFLKDRSSLLQKLSDDNYCNEVYSTISNGIITFFYCNHTPLIQMTINSDRIKEEVEY